MKRKKIRITKIEREKQAVDFMIGLYCHKKEGNDTLCASCRELLNYANKRLEHCKFGNNKPSCKNCKIHCYNPEMREAIRKIMHFSGPRMIFHSPLLTIKHIFKY